MQILRDRSFQTLKQGYLGKGVIEQIRAANHLGDSGINVIKKADEIIGKNTVPSF